MAPRVRVASRALRRGRRLRARTSMPPPMPEPADSQDADAEDDEPILKSNYSRPPAPVFGGAANEGATLAELARQARGETTPGDNADVDWDDDDEHDEDLDEEHDDAHDGTASAVTDSAVTDSAVTDSAVTDSAMAAGEPLEEAAQFSGKGLLGADTASAQVLTESATSTPRAGSNAPPAKGIALDAGDPTLESPKMTRDELVSASGDAEPASSKADDAAAPDSAAPDSAAPGSAAPGSAAPGSAAPDSEAPESDLAPSSEQALSDSKLRRLDRALAAGMNPRVEVMRDSSATRRGPAPLTKEELERRNAMRRYVTIGLGAAALIALALIIKSALSEDTKPAPTWANTAAMVPEPSATTKKPAAPEPEPIDTLTQNLEAMTVDDLTTATVDLLNDRDFETAEKAARLLVKKTPNSAFGYRCLGASLQDQGRLSEAKEVYSQCVQNATEGHVDECGALGGRAE